MKRLTISKLMDEYTDTEFFPTGGSTANPEAVKGWVLANAKPAKQKKQMPRRKKVLLAAALAAVMVVLAGAGFPYIQHRLVGGTLSFQQNADGSRITAFVHNSEVVKYEDGRLIFTQDDGQRIDITDLVGEETPYIYDGSDPDTGMAYYIIMGGTPESFGWFEWIQTPYLFDDGAVDFDENGNPVSITSGFVLTNPENNRRSVGGFGGVYWDDAMDHPWLLAGMEQLGITFDEPPETNGTSYVLE